MKIQFQLDELQVHSSRSKRLFVVRDDLLAGGTKERACRGFLEILSEGQSRKFVYASPFCGFAQVALARACESLNQTCVLFVARDPNFEDMRAHEYSKLAASFGAEIVVCENLQDAHEKSIAYAKETDSVLVPLGFDHPDFHRLLKAALTEVWQQIESMTSRQPKRLWLPVGSGTLAKCLREIVPSSIALRLVNVSVLSEDDSRLKAVKCLENVHFVSAPEIFEEPSKVPPPIPSNLHYDAKLWRFLETESVDGDVWWNVAR